MSMPVKKHGRRSPVRTGNAVVDALWRERSKRPGSLIVTGNPAQAEEIKSWGIPADDVGVLLSLDPGIAIVINRKKYNRLKAQEDELVQSRQGATVHA